MVASPTFEDLIARDFDIAGHAAWPTFDELRTIDIAISREDIEAVERGDFASGSHRGLEDASGALRSVGAVVARATLGLVRRLH